MFIKGKARKLKGLLDKDSFIEEIIWLDETDSTQDYMKRILKESRKAVKNILLVADKQTKSYGRFKRKWHSPSEGLWFTVYMKIDLSPDKIQQLMTDCVFSIARTLDGILASKNIETRVKSPNDILIENKKIAGCLMETSIRNREVEWVMLGVGINVNNKIPAEIEAVAVSLKSIIKKNTDLIYLLSITINNLNRTLIPYLNNPTTSS